MDLVLSIFPGIDMLGMAFEQEGFCVVRGPDVLWGGDIRCFHPPPGKFGGIIGGPPCPEFSPLRYLIAAHGYQSKHGNLIPEFERCVTEAQPRWFLMEEGVFAPDVDVPGYASRGFFLSPTWLGEEQSRKRRFCFGLKGEQSADLRRYIDYAVFEPLVAQPAVTHHADPYPVAIRGSGKPKIREALVLTNGEPTVYENGRITKGPARTLAEMCRLQGLPEDFLSGGDVPFTLTGKRMVIGNGVPLSMGRSLATAVLRAVEAS